MGRQEGTLVTPVIASAPAGVKGQVYFDDTTKKLMYHNGTAWVDPSAGGGGGSPGGASGSVQYNNGGAFGGAASLGVEGGDIRIVDNGSPATPAAGGLKLSSRLKANRRTLYMHEPDGRSTGLQPHLGFENIGMVYSPGNSTTTVVVGTLALTTQGTATARNIATTNIVTRTKRTGFVSAATAGAFAEARFNALQLTAGDGAGLGGFLMDLVFAQSNAATVAGERTFVGLRDSTAAGTNVEPSTLTNCIGLGQLSTDATQWYWVYGGSAAQTAIALGTTIGAPTSTTILWRLTVYAPPNVANTFYARLENVGSGVVVNQTFTGGSAVVPQSTTLLAPRVFKTNNATAAAVGIDFSKLYMETDQ